MAESSAASQPRPNDFFTFALYFSEKKSKQLCQFLGDYPFTKTDGSSGSVAPHPGSARTVRGVKLLVDDARDGTVVVKAVDNNGAEVDARLVDVLLQKASVDMDEGRLDRIAAIQSFCDANAIRIIDPFELALPICSSRTFVTSKLSGGPAGEGFANGKTALEMLNFWGFLIPSTYKLTMGGLKPDNIFEEPNAPYRADVMIIKPEVASQRSYSHDLQVIQTRALIKSVEDDALSEVLVGAAEGCSEWIAQDCLSLLALPMVYKAYIAGDYLSIMRYDAEAFNTEVSKVSNEEGCPPLLMQDGSKGLFTPIMTLSERKEYHDRGPVQAECSEYFIKGSKNYDDLWQTVQFLKRPENLGIHFFGMDIIVVKGIDGQKDRRYIVDVNYLPSYKNEVPARLFAAFIKTMQDIHQ